MKKASTTITITASADGQTSVTTTTSTDVAVQSSVSGAPTADEIALIRDVYPFIKTKEILVRVVTEYVQLEAYFYVFN